MKNKIVEVDFDFEHTGSNLMEKDAIDNGFTQLTGRTLISRINNVTVYGDYLMGYNFLTDIHENGNAEGINNLGTHTFGNWSVDVAENTLSLKWDNDWFDTVTRAYDVNGTIEFYDIDTGNWRTTFKKIKRWKED